jgi:hypothetical protein
MTRGGTRLRENGDQAPLPLGKALQALGRPQRKHKPDHGDAGHGRTGLAEAHSMIWSARAMSTSGISSPRAAAVLALISNS